MEGERGRIYENLYRRYPQSFFQRVVEHRIASGVGEIGENDRVLFWR